MAIDTNVGKISIDTSKTIDLEEEIYKIKTETKDLHNPSNNYISMQNRNSEIEEINLDEEVKIENTNDNKSFLENISSFAEETTSIIGTTLKKTGATIGTGVVSLTEGVSKFAESIVDVAELAGTTIATIGTGLYDGGQALYGMATGEDWESVTKKMWEGSKAFVAEDYVSSAFDNFYEKNTIGQFLKDNSYGFETVRGVSSGIGYIGGTVALTVATCGAGTAIMGSTIAVNGTTLAGTAAVAGMGKGTEKAWSEGASTLEGLGTGALTGAWEGLQFYLGSKIGNTEILAADSVKNKLINSLARISLDGLDGGVEGIVQPLIDSIYKDGYINENGEYIEFTNENIVEKYQELFDEAGGWKNVGIQTAIGAGSSAIGEGLNLRKYFNLEEDITDIEIIANKYKEISELLHKRIWDDKRELMDIQGGADINLRIILAREYFGKSLDSINIKENFKLTEVIQSIKQGDFSKLQISINDNLRNELQQQIDVIKDIENQLLEIQDEINILEDNKIKFMKENNLTENDIKDIENYNNRYKIINEPKHDIIEINNAKFSAEIDGIKLKSNTKEGLDKLTTYYQNLKSEYKYNEKAKTYIKNLENKGLIITDINIDKPNIISRHKSGYVYLTEQVINNNSFSTFFHETGHFQDYIHKYYDIGLDGVSRIKEQIGIVTLAQAKKLNLAHTIMSYKITLYLSTPKELYIILRKAMDRIKKEVLDYGECSLKDKIKIFDQYTKDIINQRLDYHMKKTGLPAIEDIVDALTDGHFQDKYNVYGHGVEYYKNNELVPTEILANFSDLYNNNKLELIDKYISKEFRQQLTNIFKIINS